MTKISVVVPVYNVEPYLRTCIESLICQTYKKLEVILVDDGSTDRCPMICDEYAAKDSRITVIHKLNGGLSDARNAGLDIATGDLVAFVDSDDWVEPDMYEKLLSAMERSGSDVSVSNFFIEYDVSRVGMPKTNQEYLLSDADTIFKSLVGGRKCIRFEVWNKLFKKEIIGSIRFKNGQIFEDLYFDRMVFAKCRAVCRIDDSLYHYRIARPGNTVSTFKADNLSKFVEVMCYVDMFLASNKFETADNYSLYGINSTIWFYYTAKRNNADATTIFEIKNYCCLFYHKLIHKTFIISIKYFLFFYFPTIYKVNIDLKSLFPVK